MTELEPQPQLNNNSKNIDNTDNATVTNTKKDKTTSLPPHPLGVKPMGNIYLDKFEPNFDSKVRERGLGALNAFDDNFILELLNLLEAKDLVNLMQVSKPFYIFSNNNEVWKQLVISLKGGKFNFKKNWKYTYFSLINKNFNVEEVKSPKFKLKNFYSDILYQPWVCTTTPLDRFLARDNIPRRSGLSVEEFINEFEKPNKPVIITDVVTKWPGFGKWNETYLREKFGDVVFRAEAIDITLNDYFDYANQNQDESPIYLFDKKFGENCPSMLDDFSVPEYFNEDLFSLLGAQRPDYRWIIIGPKRSGSTFHKDPNSTSAWNAVLTGSKFWIMFPPEVPPPGVFTNQDESEVTSPVSIMEWFLNFHKYCKKWEVKPVQGVCKAGEVIFVPNGWWHLVVNLEDSIALTQNYVSSQNITNVLKFLRDKKDQVSGCELGESLFDKFSKVYETKNPELVEKIKEEGRKKNEKSSWENLTQEANNGGGFSFGFNF